jgi:competence protein ComEC
VTLAAPVFTLPLLIYNFGYFSLISPITNILIVPLLPYIMVLGFVLGLTGMVWSFLAWIFSFPLWLLLTYLIKIVDFFSQISWASLTLKISWFWLVVFYLTLFSAVWQLSRKRKPEFLG